MFHNLEEDFVEYTVNLQKYSCAYVVKKKKTTIKSALDEMPFEDRK